MTNDYRIPKALTIVIIVTFFVSVIGVRMLILILKILEEAPLKKKLLLLQIPPNYLL